MMTGCPAVFNVEMYASQTVIAEQFESTGPYAQEPSTM